MASSMTPVFPEPVGALTTTLTSDRKTAGNAADCTELKYLRDGKRAIRYHQMP